VKQAFFSCDGELWQPQVTAASVNLTTETALVRVVSPTPDIVGWEKTKGQIAEVLAKHLTNCGFKSTVRGNSSPLKVLQYFD